MRVALAVPMKNLREAGYLRAEDRRAYLTAFPACVAIERAERKAAAHFPVQVAADIILFFVEFVAAVKVHMTIEWFEVDGLAERCVAIDEGLQLRRRKAIAEQGIVRETVSVALGIGARSEEHTSELQSLLRISYAVFCLKKKKDKR